MAKIGYVRVSTTEQHLDRQLSLMNELGVDRIFEDKATGKNLQRPGFQEMMRYLRSGDTVYIESLSRLSRSTRELLDTVDQFQKKGVFLVSQKEQIDTDSPSGKLILTVFAAIAEFEREISKERQREGIEQARKRGAYKGGTRITDGPELEIALRGWQSGELTAVQAARVAGMSRASFYNRINERGLCRKEKL